MRERYILTSVKDLWVSVWKAVEESTRLGLFDRNLQYRFLGAKSRSISLIVEIAWTISKWRTSVKNI